MQQQRRGVILNATGAQIPSAYTTTVGPACVNPIKHSSMGQMRFYWQFIPDASSLIGQLFFKVDHRYNDGSGNVLDFHSVSTKRDGGQILQEQIITVSRARAAGSFTLTIASSLDDMRLSVHSDVAGRGTDSLKIALLGWEP